MLATGLIGQITAFVTGLSNTWLVKARLVKASSDLLEGAHAEVALGNVTPG